MHHPGSVRPAARLALALLLVAGACSPSAAAPTTAPTNAPTTAPTPAPTTAASTAPATTPSATATAATVLDTSSIGAAFPLKLRMTIPAGWFALVPPSTDPEVPARTLNVLHGDRNGDRDKWAGPGFALVDGARVRNPAKDAVAGDSDLIPWPASYLDYLAKLPGVEVLDGPSPVTIGGQAGREISVKTPAMAPTIWLKDDYAMLGGGANGVDPAVSRYLVELNVKGTPLLIEFDDGLTDYEGDFQIVKSLLASIVFEG